MDCGGIVLAVLIGGAAAAVRAAVLAAGAAGAADARATSRNRRCGTVIEAARQNVLDKPCSADAWGLLGMTLLTNLFTDDADRCFVEAARLDPRDPRWPYARGLDRPETRPGPRPRLAATSGVDLPAPTGDQPRYRSDWRRRWWNASG